MDILKVLQKLYDYFGAKDFRELIETLIYAKTHNGRVQFFRYIFVGGFSAIVDIGSLYIFTSAAHIYYLWSAFFAFILGTVVNYALSIWWIFERSSKFKLEFTLFTLIGVGGLLLNELIIWLCVSKLGLFYLLGKLVSVLVVVIWSFSLRKLLFDKLAGA